MEWQAVVMALQILMLAVAWVLFQKARAELSAKAAEEPVLSEVRALQRQVKALLLEIEETGEAAAAKVEGRCVEARELLLALERQVNAVQLSTETAVAPKRNGRRAASALVDDTPIQAVITSSSTETVETAPTPTKKRAATGAKRGRSTVTEAEQTVAVASPAPELSPTLLHRNSIYSLADQGETATAIARKTGLSEGEVETLLGLRVQRR
jgi:hypothetical protein